MVLDGLDDAAVATAAARLAAGELVAFPTETVYGLGARADDDAAVARIFAMKGRPVGHPLIVHVAQPGDAAAFADPMPPLAARLIEALWPGPVTVIVPRKLDMAGAAAAHLSTIALRCPAHAVAHSLLAAAHALGVPGVAAPSANRFGRVSPTTAAHVVDELGTDLIVLDGGAAQLGIESAIVDCSGGHPVLLRPGVLTRERIESAAGERLLAPDESSPRAPGTLAAHYAPRAKVRLMTTPMLRCRLERARLGADQAGGIFPLGAIRRCHRRPAPAHAGTAGTGGVRIVFRPARTRSRGRASHLGRGAAARSRVGGRARPTRSRRGHLNHRLRAFPDPGAMNEIECE